MKQIRITLDEALTARNITRYRLAKQINVKYQTLDNYYKNKIAQYDSAFLLKVCEALDCGVEEIIRIFELE